MKPSPEKDRKYLNWHNQRGIAWVISRGYRWFKEKYLPAIHRLEKADFKKDRYLLGWCYYMIGDVHDFNRCPKAAIRAYKTSISLDSNNAAALREMGIMYETIGQYKKAASLLKKAIQIDPEDGFAIADLECLCSEGPPLYDKEDVYWQAREYLAQDNPKSALKLLANKRNIPARHIRACAYAVLNDKDAVIEQWNKISRVKNKIEVTFSDWFYMTDAVWDNSVFWEIVASCAKEDRFAYGVWPISNDVYEYVVRFPKRRKRNSVADLSRCNKCNYLLAQYHIARINRDLKLAQQLFHKYPQWMEIEKLYYKLSG